MLKLFLCLAVLLLSIQLGRTGFYVRVEALTDHDSRYIFNRSNRIIPQDRLVKESDIQGAVQCLVDDLKASGMFEDVRAKLLRTSEADVRKLEIETIYHRQMGNLTISEVSLDKLPQVDDVKFQAALKKRGITVGLPLLRYYYSGLEERINDSLAEASSNSINEGIEPAWITIRPAGSRKLKVIVSPGYSVCSRFAS
jgi:hypothetical protein